MVNEKGTELNDKKAELAAAKAELAELKRQEKEYGDKEVIQTNKKVVSGTSATGFTLVPVYISDPPEAKKARKERILELEKRQKVAGKAASKPGIIPTLEKEVKSLQKEYDYLVVFAMKDPPEKFDNPNGVQVDLNKTGVAVHQYSGRLQGPPDWNIDPVFAVAMIKFLIRIRDEFCVMKMYNNAFQVAPRSPIDIHPRGLAADLNGFIAHGHHIALRLGENLPKGHKRYNASKQSDWYNEEDRIEQFDMTYAQFIKTMGEVMVDYFGCILGPCYNADHQSHYHVQLKGSSGKAGAFAKYQKGI